MGKKGKEAKRREKKQRTGRKHSSLKPHEHYGISGNTVTRKRKGCPRCGPGTILSEHKGRLYCGKCGYTEFERKPSQEKPGQSRQVHLAAEANPAPEKPQEEKPSPEDKQPEPPKTG
jgi:small subunit ribosomal protein S27Ae